MEGFRKLEKEEILSFAKIAVNAYPGFRISSEEDIQNYAKRMQDVDEIDPRIDYYGLFREGVLVGGFCMFNFELNFLGVHIKAGGVAWPASRTRNTSRLSTACSRHRSPSASRRFEPWGLDRRNRKGPARSAGPFSYTR